MKTPMTRLKEKYEKLKYIHKRLKTKGCRYFIILPTIINAVLYQLHYCLSYVEVKVFCQKIILRKYDKIKFDFLFANLMANECTKAN